MLTEERVNFHKLCQNWHELTSNYDILMEKVEQNYNHDNFVNGFYARVLDCQSEAHEKLRECQYVIVKDESLFAHVFYTSVNRLLMLDGVYKVLIKDFDKMFSSS